MNRVSGSLLATALFLGSTPLTAQPTPQSSKPEQGGETVLIGCLRQSRADTTTASRKGMIYTLDFVEPEGAPSSTAKDESAARAAAVAETRYALSFEDAIDAAKHVGHRVQVTGRLLPRAAGEAKSQSAPPPKPLPGAAEQLVHVSALKMIAAKCP